MRSTENGGSVLPATGTSPAMVEAHGQDAGCPAHGRQGPLAAKAPGDPLVRGAVALGRKRGRLRGSFTNVPPLSRSYQASLVKSLDLTHPGVYLCRSLGQIL